MTNLAERRAQVGGHKKPRATADMTRVEGRNLLIEQKRLSDELDDLRISLNRVDDEGEPVGPPQKVGARSTAARVADIRVELADVTRRVGEFQDVVTIEGCWTGGEWHLWKEAHPAREGEAIDKTIALGWCNATDLLAELGKFVVEVNSESVAPGEWDAWLAEDYIYADRRELVKHVIGLYEMQVDRAPKSRTSLSSTETSETD